jgi:hypothetical protein
MTVMPAANSEEAVSIAINRRPNASAGFKTACRWSPSEWKYEAFGDEYFDDLCRRLASEPKGDDISIFTSRLVAAMTSALDNLKTFLFAHSNLDASACTFFISISDDDNAREIEDRSAQVLNSQPVFEVFHKRCAAVL